MISYKIIDKIRERGLKDDLDVLYYSKNYNLSLKNSYYFQFLPTDVKKVDDGFYITEKLDIAVARLSKVKEKGEIDRDELIKVYEGAIIHENMHVLGFPMMVRAREVLSPVVDYLTKKGVEVNEELLNHVENIVSDIINEVLTQVKGIDYDRIPTTRYHYIVKGSKENEPRDIIEVKFPLKALFMKHNEVFTDIYFGRKPVFKSYKSDVVYRLIRSFAREFDIDIHLSSTNVGGFSYNILRPLITELNLYDIMDDFYEWYKETGAKTTKEERTQIKNIFSHLPSTFKLYALYYSLVSTMYRFELEAIKNGERNINDIAKSCASVDKRGGSSHIPIPSPEEASEILTRIISGELLLDPDTLDRITDNLLSEIITVRGVRFTTKLKGGEQTVPFYRNPRGRIDPISLMKSQRGFLDWEVYEETEYSYFEREYVTGSPPDHFTAVIDISGSTSSESAILSPLVGSDTTVFDVERAIVISLMKLTRKYGGDEVKATIHLFNDDVVSQEGKIAKMINFLLGKEEEIVPFGGTDIIEAARRGTMEHRDRPDNPFILVTDLAIERREEIQVYNILKANLKRSPILVVVIGGEISVLEKLNRERHSAAVSIKTIGDLKKLENAMRKISSAITS